MWSGKLTPPTGECKKQVVTDDYRVTVVDNDTTDIEAENKTNEKLKLQVTLSKLNNQDEIDESVSNITLNKKQETVRNIGNAQNNTLCIEDVKVKE